MDAEKTLLACWGKLKGICRLTMVVSQQNEIEEKQAEGKVQVIEETPSMLLFWESGHWQDEKRMQFTNALRWTLELSNGSIGLEHLRQGRSHPVFLFHLKPAKKGRLVSIDPHVCGRDTYLGQVDLGPHFLKLSWRIVGPKKNDWIEIRYSGSLSSRRDS
jgi:hypothetical protein